MPKTHRSEWLWLMLLLAPACALAQTTDIDDIQFYQPILGTPASPYAGQLVTIQGVIYAATDMLDDSSLYVRDATGGIRYPAYIITTGIVPHIVVPAHVVRRPTYPPVCVFSNDIVEYPVVTGHPSDQ